MGLVKWLRSANASIYSCHFLAAWSGRMWSFSLGLFLILVSPKSLHLSATYGLSMGAAVLLFGSIIGDWVDKTPRLKAATVSMICQNILIATCACVVLILTILLSELGEIANWLRYLLYAIIISLSVSSRLMKEARIIVVERDWIVEMCAKDEHQLAVMTSSFQRIDLLTKILAPIVTGQIMTFAGLKIGCGFIALWSLISLGTEYFLIRRVYNIVPALKMGKRKASYTVTCELNVQTDADESAFIGTDKKSDEKAEYEIVLTDCVKTSDTTTIKSCTILKKLLASFLILYQGIKTYFRSATMWPGLALACLYLTVLTMGNITVGYGTIQGLSGSTLGILTGVGAGFGILATCVYPIIVNKLGLPKTGVLALGLQVTCLTLCVISVWLPGSSFGLSLNHKLQETNGIFRNCSTGLYNQTEHEPDKLTADIMMPNKTTCFDDLPHHDSVSNLSIWVMITGIILARFGLWTGHMTIVQIFLENVVIDKRGIVNGFQTSLNQLMNFFIYALVINLPHPHQFGFLVFISYTFICIGWIFMGVNAVKNTKQRNTKINNDIRSKIRIDTEM
uniref:Solute carrier family 40 member n=1 Tax=Arion vulgaris TaxID=1028688 RepID=A0A0B7ARE6_9EUPU